MVCRVSSAMAVKSFSSMAAFIGLVMGVDGVEEALRSGLLMRCGSGHEFSRSVKSGGKGPDGRLCLSNGTPISLAALTRGPRRYCAFSSASAHRPSQHHS